jgi:hypothetical protein
MYGFFCKDCLRLNVSVIRNGKQEYQESLFLDEDGNIDYNDDIEYLDVVESMDVCKHCGSENIYYVSMNLIIHGYINTMQEGFVIPNFVISTNDEMKFPEVPKDLFLAALDLPENKK